jgi:hypothetical protein
MAGSKAFWSYVHKDDNDEGGRISELSRLLVRRLRLLSGHDFTIFLDKADLGWGVTWQSAIDEALLTTTFFIPIITPSYFLSESCREELLTFTSAATRLDLAELVLPIYYATVPEFESGPPFGDELVRLVKERQWVDWRAVSLADHDSSVHRTAVNDLAEKLLRHASSADQKPTLSGSGQVHIAMTATATGVAIGPSISMTQGDSPSPSEGSPEAGSSGVPGEQAQLAEDQPGDLDVLVIGQEALEKIPLLAGPIGLLIEEIGKLFDEATQSIARSDAQNRGFAGRLVVARNLAAKLDEPADRLEQIVPALLEEVLKVDSMMDTLCRLILQEDDPTEAVEVLQGLIDMSNTSGDAMANTGVFLDQLSQMSQWSKDLRRPILRIDRSVRQLKDSKRIYDRWSELLTSTLSRISHRPGS